MKDDPIVRLYQRLFQSVLAQNSTYLKNNKQQ